MTHFFAGRALLGLGLLGALTGCRAIIGIHDVRQVSPAEVAQLARHYHLPPGSQVAVLDTSYRQLLTSLRSRPEVMKNHYQPLQASYYDAAGQLRAFYVNCYAGGFPNLIWNATGGLNQFPPAPQAPADSALPLATYWRYLRQPDGQLLPPPTGADYTVVVQWGWLMGRQSQRLLAAVQRNVALARPGQRVQLVFVNNDNLLYHLAELQERRANRSKQ